MYDTIMTFRALELPFLPRLSLEMTQPCLTSRVGDHVEEFYTHVARVKPKKTESVRKRCDAFFKLVLPRLRSRGVRFRKAVYIGSFLDNLATISPCDVDVLLVFDLGKAKFQLIDSGCCCLRLPKRDPKSTGLFKAVLSEDGCCISPLKMYSLLDKLVSRAADHPVVLDNVQSEFYVNETVVDLTVTINKTIRLHLIPAVDLGCSRPFAVARPYCFDAETQSDVKWRLCHWQAESDILNKMDMADRGVRKKALVILKAIVFLDEKLRAIPSYHLKTVMLHSFDWEVDTSPRWQRNSLEDSFRCLMNSFKNYLDRKTLPHFFFHGVNMFANIPDRTISRARCRISQLLTRNEELIRVLNWRPD